MVKAPHRRVYELGGGTHLEPVANRILAALPEEEYKYLLPRLEFATLKFKQVLYEPKSLSSAATVVIHITIARELLADNRSRGLFLSVETRPSLKPLWEVPYGRAKSALCLVRQDRLRFPA